MRIVILTVGPQGAGKSTFCKKFVQIRMDVHIVSRDDILTRMFGSVHQDRYQHAEAKETMWRSVARHLAKPHTTVILDCWNGTARERKIITAKLRELGAEKIIAWRFVTPEKNCIEWIFTRDPHMKSHRNDYLHDYRLFNRHPVRYSQGFDSIIKINPLVKFPDAIKIK